MTPDPLTEQARLLCRLRWGLGIIILALFMSGITAFPLQLELEQFAAIRGLEHATATETSNGFDWWILTIRDGLKESYAKHPWLAYGTDWVAFAHLIIAIFFAGAFMDPVRNVWIIKTGIIAAVMVVPFALIAGGIRQLPLGWRLIDCSFGIFGLVPLCYCLRLTKVLEKLSSRRKI